MWVTAWYAGWNKYIKKSVKLVISKDRTEMHGQQIIKLYVVILKFLKNQLFFNIPLSQILQYPMLIVTTSLGVFCDVFDDLTN